VLARSAAGRLGRSYAAVIEQGIVSSAGGGRTWQVRYRAGSQLDSHPGWAASMTRLVLRAVVASTLLDAAAHAAQHFAEWWAAG